MGKLRWLLVSFDGDTAEYCPGDLIRGRVSMEIDPSDDGRGLEDVNGIWVRFRGKAKTKFTPRNDDSSVTSKEHYFDETLVFGAVEHVRSRQDRTLLPGRHVFPFEFQIPNNRALPQSFEGTNGYVRYVAKATLRRNKTFYDKKYKEEKWFRLKGPLLDLSVMSNAEEPIHRNTEVPTCCGCSDEDVESIISLVLPRMGYLPGEIIYVTGHVDNRTGDENVEFRSKFIQQITYTSQNHSKSKKVTLSEQTERFGCPKGRLTGVTLGPLLVPPDAPPTGLSGCNLIDIEYSVKCHWTCTETFRVVIGTTRSTSSNPPVISTAPRLNAMGDFTVIWGTPTADGNENDCPPPSYEEAVALSLSSSQGPTSHPNRSCPTQPTKY